MGFNSVKQYCAIIKEFPEHFDSFSLHSVKSVDTVI